MIDFHLYCQIRELHCKQHLSYKAIAENLHLHPQTNNNPPAEPEVFRLRPPQRGLIAIDEKQTHFVGGIVK